MWSIHTDASAPASSSEVRCSACVTCRRLRPELPRLWLPAHGCCDSAAQQRPAVVREPWPRCVQLTKGFLDVLARP